MRRGRAQAFAIGGALVVFLVLLLALRLRSWLPFIGAALTYLGLLWALWRDPRPATPAVALPDGVARQDYETALDALDEARRQLAVLATEAPPAEQPLIGRMARLVGAIRGHHLANPGHLPRTRAFVHHTLGRMVAAVAGYVDLARRAGPAPDHAARSEPAPGSPAPDDRLADIRRRLEGFVPVLERIDRACIDDDLMALEINVEVLDEQLGGNRPASREDWR